MTETTTIPSRIAECADTDGHTIHGVAIRAGEVTRGLNGRKKWPADVLRASAQSLEGTPVNLLHSEQDIGEVTRAGYSEAQDAVVYEADIEDEKIWQQVHDGRLEPSIESAHGKDGTDGTGAMLVANNRFTGLSLVQHGASQAGNADAGVAPQQAFAARLSVGEIETALGDGPDPEEDAESADPSDEDADDPADEAAEAAHPLERDAEAGDIVTWNSQGDRPAVGRVVETISEGRFDTELGGDAVVNAPAALIRLHRPDEDGEWARTSTMVAKRTDGEALSVRGEWPDLSRANAAAAEDVQNPTIPAESGVDADDDDATQSMSDDDPEETETETETEAVESPDTTELKARLADKTDRIDDLEAELADVREERDELETKAAAVEEAEQAFAAALADHVPRDAEALRADLSLSQMQEWLDEIDGADVGDAATVETDDPDPEVQTGGGEGQTAQLSATEKEEKQDLESQIEQQEARLASVNDGSMGHRLATREKERLEDELAELTEA